MTVKQKGQAAGLFGAGCFQIVNGVDQRQCLGRFVQFRALLAGFEWQIRETLRNSIAVDAGQFREF